MNRTSIAEKISVVVIALLAVISCKPRGPQEAEPVEIASITASSSLKPSKNHNYWAELAIDGNVDSSWVEGVKGDGVGEFLKLQLNQSFKLTEFTIANGFGVPAYWMTNNRVKDLAITAGGTEVVVTLRDSKELQLIKLPRALEGKEFIFKIRSVYPGTKDRDTAISEIMIPGVAKKLSFMPEAKPASVTETSDSGCNVGSEMGIQSSNTIKFRSEPSYSASSFTEYSTGPGAGDIVRIERCSDGWIYASYRGHSGWISPKYQCANLESNCIGAGE